MDQVVNFFSEINLNDIPPVTSEGLDRIIPFKFLDWSPLLQHMREFRVTRDLPFMDYRYPLLFSCGYLIVIFILYKIMKNFKNPLPFASELSIMNNLLMSFVSLLMLIGMLVGLYELGSEHAWDPLILFCDPDKVFGNRGMLHFTIYVFYLSKLYELTDTVILCIKKSSLSGLHVFHHAYTMWMVWGGLYYSNPLQWSEFLNAFVHVPMYYYFGKLELTGKRAWWKDYITIIQLTQFILIISSMCTGYYYHYSLKMNCSSFGDSWNNEWSLAGLVIYVYLFGSLYVANQKKAAERKKKAALANKDSNDSNDNKKTKKAGKTKIGKKESKKNK